MAGSDQIITATRWNNDVLYCSAECPLLALSGHHGRAEPCPLLGVKQTWPGLLPCPLMTLAVTQPSFHSQMWYPHRARPGARLAGWKTAGIHGASGLRVFS